MRVFLTQILPILLPALVYLAWRIAVKRRAAAAGEADARRLTDGPWIWLFAAGLALAGAVLVATALLTGAPTEGRYEPPHMEDGRIVPGTVRP